MNAEEKCNKQNKTKQDTKQGGKIVMLKKLVSKTNSKEMRKYTYK